MKINLNQLNMKLELSSFMTYNYRNYFINEFRRYLLGAGFSYEEMYRLRWNERDALWEMYAEDVNSDGN